MLNRSRIGVRDMVQHDRIGFYFAAGLSRLGTEESYTSTLCVIASFDKLRTNGFCFVAGLAEEVQ